MDDFIHNEFKRLVGANLIAPVYDLQDDEIDSITMENNQNAEIIADRVFKEFKEFRDSEMEELKPFRYVDLFYMLERITSSKYIWDNFVLSPPSQVNHNYFCKFELISLKVAQGLCKMKLASAQYRSDGKMDYVNLSQAGMLLLRKIKELCHPNNT